MALSTTIDGLLNHRIIIEQPKEGYRVAIDTLLLAASVPALPGNQVLDLGCGVGGAMLALACRIPGVKVIGLEIQSELSRLCLANIERNSMHTTLNVMTCDATSLPFLMKETFDHVMMNPPYHDEIRHDVSIIESARVAKTEPKGSLKKWIASAAQALKPEGMLTLIHRADRLDEIVNLLESGFGTVSIKPVKSKANDPNKRIIVRAKKGTPFSQEILPPIIMHNSDGSYTPEADSVLRDAKGVDFS